MKGTLHNNDEREPEDNGSLVVGAGDERMENGEAWRERQAFCLAGLDLSLVGD